MNTTTVVDAHGMSATLSDTTLTTASTSNFTIDYWQPYPYVNPYPYGGWYPYPVSYPHVCPQPAVVTIPVKAEMSDVELDRLADKLAERIGSRRKPRTKRSSGTRPPR